LNAPGAWWSGVRATVEGLKTRQGMMTGGIILGAVDRTTRLARSRNRAERPVYKTSGRVSSRWKVHVPVTVPDCSRHANATDINNHRDMFVKISDFLRTKTLLEYCAKPKIRHLPWYMYLYHIQEKGKS
jgi:hypothetical protein